MKQIKRNTNGLKITIAVLSGLLLALSARAETLISDFDNGFFFYEQYGSWAFEFPEPQPTNWMITATNVGSAYRGLDSNVNASAENTVEFTMTITNATGTIRPLVYLEDADGTLWSWTWPDRTNDSHVLTADLGTPFAKPSAGTNAGLDLSNIISFQIQIVPTVTTASYTVILENLSLIYVEPPTPKCYTLVSDFDGSGVDGGYGSWSPPPGPQPNDWTITATDFGGGWKNIVPNINAAGETTIQLSLTLTNTVGEVGAIVVFQDGDTTQETWEWFGLTNGSYVLTGDLSAGNAVTNWPGTVPGLDVSDLDWFHIQVDDGTNVVTYTVTFEDFRLIGFDPTITDYSYDPSTGQYDLTWDSRPNRSYGVAYVSDLSGSFSVLASNILSGGTSTTNTVVMPAGDSGYLQVYEECDWQ